MIQKNILSVRDYTKDRTTFEVQRTLNQIAVANYTFASSQTNVEDIVSITHICARLCICVCVCIGMTTAAVITATAREIWARCDCVRVYVVRCTFLLQMRTLRLCGIIFCFFFWFWNHDISQWRNNETIRYKCVFIFSHKKKKTSQNPIQINICFVPLLW